MISILLHARTSGLALALAGFSALSAIPALAQNAVVNGDFSQGETGWTVYQMLPESATAGEVMFDDTEDCPTNGSPGGCAFMFGSDDLGEVEVLLWQEITLIAGTPYVVDAHFRYLAETAVQNWSELYLGDVAPQPNQKWLGHAHWSFNAYENCSGLGVDGKFSEHACQGRQTLEFVPPGEPGTELTYYVGIKSGMWQGGHFALAIDDVTVASAEGSFAVANFSTSPSGRVVLGNPITFDASASTASGNITDYQWDFGDGTTGSGVTVEHTYAEYDTYDVTLVVTTDQAVVDSTTMQIRVWDGRGLADTPLEVPRAPEGMVIDGVRDAQWDGAQSIRIETRTAGVPIDGPEDLTANAYLMWDEEAIYVLFDVVDDSLVNDRGETWDGDAAEFNLDGGNEKDSTYDDNDQAWEFGWGDASISGLGSGAVEGALFVSLTKDDGKGYVIELKMPWANVGVTKAVGDMIGFEAAVNDADEALAGRQTKLAWFAEPFNDSAWQTTTHWANARLVEELVSAAEPQAGVPGSFALEGIYPNPFNPGATAVVTVRETGDYTVRLYNVLGQLVEGTVVSAQSAGTLQVPFDLSGRASGTYFVWIQHKKSGQIVTGKAMLLK